MKKYILGLFLLMVCIVVSLLLFGCQNQKIIFNRESQASSLINKFSAQNQEVKKGTGIIILKDNENKNGGINFGPSDINFDMPIRFK